MNAPGVNQSDSLCLVNLTGIETTTVTTTMATEATETSEGTTALSETNGTTLSLIVNSQGSDSTPTGNVHNVTKSLSYSPHYRF